jgi:hypothetical protein
MDNQETFTKDTRRRQAKHKNKAQLLKGSPDLSFDDNVLIMNSVHTFICGTKRLDY